MTATATFDNLELRTYEVPQVGIERAVELTIPTGYDIEAAPTVDGPWLPVNDSTLPGLQQKIAPAGDLMKYFRARKAP